MRVAFGTKMNGKVAKYLGFNQISSDLHQLFPRSRAGTRKISHVIPDACDPFLSFPLPAQRQLGVETGPIVLRPQGEVFSSVRMTVRPAVTAELFLARDHSTTSAAYRVVCYGMGQVQLTEASSQTWLLLWQQEKAQVLGRDRLCLSCTGAGLP